jgi:GTP-binding protein
MKFQTIEFLKTVVQSEEIPFLNRLPEIAILGRSNVGKSTLLNHLFGSRNLVKTSSTPGKTRALNFFKVDNHFICVDMPGYGYAKVPLAEKKKWGVLIENYLNLRDSLGLVLFLFDIRRLPGKEEEQLFSWIAHRNLPAILVLTKVDKLGKSERLMQTKRITDRLKILPFVHYSATKNEGRKELIALISGKMNAST